MIPLFSYIFWSFLRIFNTLIFFVILDSIVSISNGSAAAKTIVAQPLQNKTANKSGVKPAQSTVKPVGVGRGNAPGSKATQIQPGGGSAAGKEKLKVTKSAKRTAAVGAAKHIGGKVKSFVKGALSKAADQSGFGNPLAASKYSPEDKAVDIMKGAMKKVEEEEIEELSMPKISLSHVKNMKPTKVVVTKARDSHHPPAKKMPGYPAGGHHDLRWKAAVKF